MEVLSQYLQQREILSSKLDSLLLMPYSKRSHRMVEILTDEICDLDFAISEMRKAESDYLGYRPRVRKKLHSLDMCRLITD